MRLRPVGPVRIVMRPGLGLRLGVGVALALALLAASACRSDVRLRTHAFVAPAPCGQGPYDIHLRADGTTGGDGIEVIACTPRRLAGHVIFRAGALELANRTYGEVADNQRCLAGRPTVTATAGAAAAAGATPAADPAGPPGRTAATPVLIERPFSGSETPFADELCNRLGLPAQQILILTMLTNTTSNPGLSPGTDLHIRLWSDVPNDLEGVVFMIRQATSTKTPAQAERELAKRDRGRDAEWRPVPTPPRSDHGPPPAPLLEERPPPPLPSATWIPGYWTWTGSDWGWIAGFWRDDRFALPAPRAEQPGPPPGPDAIWIGGTWQLRAGSYVWIRGRWRR